MRAFHRIPLTKFLAVTTALTCTGGGMLAGRACRAGGAVLTPPAGGNNYLCASRHGHFTCDPATVTLAGGTTFAVSDPNSRLACDEARHHRSDRFGAPTTVNLANEFSPSPGVAVPLEVDHLRSICTVTPAPLFTQSRTRALSTPLLRYACSSVHYPWGATLQFTPQFPVTANGRVLRLFGPTRVCVPVSAPGGVQAAVAGSTDLLCFRARATDNRRRFFGPRLRLCVPSSETADTPSATAPPTTTSTTTTSRPPTTQPCAGVIIGGNCIITV